MQRIKEVLHHSSSDSDKDSKDSKDSKHHSDDKKNTTETTTHPREGVEHKHKEKHVDHKDHTTHKTHDKVTIDKDRADYQQGVDPTVNREIGERSHHHVSGATQTVKQPTKIQEEVREVELHKVQPVIHREREQTEVRHVVEPHRVKDVKPTQVERTERNIDLGTRQVPSTLTTSRDIGAAGSIPQNSHKHMGVERQHSELPARVEETVHTNVIEHHHPVVYKETLVPRVKEETQHIHEVVREAPIETYEVRDVVNHESTGKMSEREFFDKFSSTPVGSTSSQTTTMSQTAPIQSTTNTTRVLAPATTAHIVQPVEGLDTKYTPAAAVPHAHKSAYDAALMAESKSEREARIKQEKKTDKKQKELDKHTTTTSSQKSTVV